MKLKLRKMFALLLVAGMVAMITVMAFAEEEAISEESTEEETTIEEEEPAEATEDTIAGICQIIDVDGATVFEVYEDFSDALADLEDGQTIQLLESITHSSGIVIIGKCVTFDVNGFALSVEVPKGHALEVGAGGEVLLEDSAGGKFNVKGGGGKHGVYAHDGGKATVTNASVFGIDINGRNVYADGAGTTVTVCGNAAGGFYSLGAFNGATVNVYGYNSGGGAMIAKGIGTTVNVSGYSAGGGTGVIASDGAIVNVGGNVIGGGYGVLASSGAQVTIDGIIKFDASGIYIRFDDTKVNKEQEDHELDSSKSGYFEYKSDDSYVWVKDTKPQTPATTTLDEEIPEEVLEEVPEEMPEAGERSAVKKAGRSIIDANEDAGNSIEETDNAPGKVEQDEPEMPAPRVSSNKVVRLEASRYMELGDGDVPLGEWHWDEQAEAWVFSEYMQLQNDLPQTGANEVPLYWFVVLGLSLAGIVASLLNGIRENKKHMK
ncbi:MAG: hypothetical protein FWG53_11375 [Clostridiales bacterium]|nr:hypothetical protein [Clostridiales bacterium]